MALHYLETGSTDPAFNLAFEEFVLENRREGDWLMLWQNANSVIVGLNQNAAEEVDPAYVRAHGIRVVRRMTGGGAVYHDLGNLNYSFITDALDTASLSMEALARPVCRALSALGVAAALGRAPGGPEEVQLQSRALRAQPGGEHPGLPPGGHGPRGVPSRDPRRADARRPRPGEPDGDRARARARPGGGEVRELGVELGPGAGFRLPFAAAFPGREHGGPAGHPRRAHP